MQCIQIIVLCVFLIFSLLSLRIYRYNNIFAYGQSKLANILHANELARRLMSLQFWLWLFFWLLISLFSKNDNIFHKAILLFPKIFCDAKKAPDLQQYEKVKHRSYRSYWVGHKVLRHRLLYLFAIADIEWEQEVLCSALFYITLTELYIHVHGQMRIHVGLTLSYGLSLNGVLFWAIYMSCFRWYSTQYNIFQSRW